MTRLFLLPLLVCIGWWLFLHYNGLSIKQGAKGFYAIFIFFGVFGLFPTVEKSLASLGVSTDGISTTNLAGTGLN